MAYAKNKHSSKVHFKTRFLPSAKTSAQKLTLLAIIVATIAVLTAIICSLVFNAERTTKSTISHLASDYYENYFYSNISSNNPAEVMNKYTDAGLTRITLRQLLLYTPQNSVYEDTLLRYCDEDNTYVVFYPKAPFGKTDYDTKYTYSCSF